MSSLPCGLDTGDSRGSCRAKLLLALLLLIGAAAGCGQWRDRSTPPAAARSDDMPTETFSHEQVIAFIGQPFPANAGEIHTAGEAALDTMVIARFDAPRQDIAAWLAGLGVTTPLEPGYSPFFSADQPFSDAASWWAPPVASETPGGFSGLYQQVGQKHFKVAVVGPENGVATVYLQVYNT